MPDIIGSGKWKLAVALVAAVMLAVAPVWAQDEDEEEEEEPPADFVMKDTGKSDWVMLSHAKHEAKVPKCTACHPKVFSSKIGRTRETKGEMTMKAMEEGAFCGTCHNGKDSFSVKPEQDCVKCHSVKKE